MKTNLSRRLRSAILCLALLAAAIPFAASAQRGGGRKQDEVVIELHGNVKGISDFIFEGSTIRYNNSRNWYPVRPFRVNGVLWEDMKTPFQLNFTPDFENASILERSRPVELNKEKDKFTVRMSTGGGNTDYEYKARIAAKYQEKREDDTPKMIPNREIKNPPALNNGETNLYGPMAAPRINEPTDGMDHPNYSVSRPVSMYRHDYGFIIKGTVDQWAGFRVQGGAVFYQNYMTLPRGTSGVSPILKGGKFASGVTVDGKSWSNLTQPFLLGFTPRLSAEKVVTFRAEQCEIIYSYHDNVLEVSIMNKSDKPAPFELFFAIMDPAVNQH